MTGGVAGVGKARAEAGGGGGAGGLGGKRNDPLRLHCLPIGPIKVFL